MRSMSSWEQGQTRPQRYDLKWQFRPPVGDPPIFAEAWGRREGSPNPEGLPVDHQDTTITYLITGSDGRWGTVIVIPGRPLITEGSAWSTLDEAKSFCQAHYDAGNCRETLGSVLTTHYPHR